MNKKWLAGIIGLLAFGAVAVAQTISVPVLGVIHPTDLFQVIPFGQPVAQSQYVTAPQLTAQYGYQKLSPATGFTYTFGNAQTFIVLTQGGTVSTGTIILAAAPSDGDRDCVYSQGTLTTFAIQANTGQTVNNGVTTLNAASTACYLYSANNTTWDRN